MLFLRGDCVHAGAFSQLSRAHLEFWPKAAAGWLRTRHPYWATTESMLAWQAKKVVFLIPDLRIFPFAYPEISEEDDNGNQIVTYPVRHTQDLFPHLDDNYIAKKEKPVGVVLDATTEPSKRPREEAPPMPPRSGRRRK